MNAMYLRGVPYVHWYHGSFPVNQRNSIPAEHRRQHRFESAETEPRELEQVAYAHLGHVEEHSEERRHRRSTDDAMHVSCGHLTLRFENLDFC